MDDNKFEELIDLYFADELDENKKAEVENLVENSPEFKAEFEKAEKFYSALSGSKPAAFTGDILLQSRRELLRNIRKEQLKPSVADRIIEWFQTAGMTGYKFAAGSVASLIIGIISGYFLFSPTLVNTVENNRNDVLSIDQVLSSNVDIGNVRLTESSPLEGKITITFEAAKPYSYTGSIEDRTAQLLLANMATKSDNPGVRIKSVKKLAETVEKKSVRDPEIKKALITTLKTDDNAGVRRSALEVLKKYPYDEKIRDAILFTLSHDQNSGIRVAAINAIAELKLDGVKLDSTVKSELSNKVKNEPNLFIKNLAESLLKGDEL